MVSDWWVAFAYNHLLGLVKDNWAQIRAEKAASPDGETHNTGYVSTNHFGLLYLWAEVRDEAAPWWSDNDAAVRLSKAFTNHRAGRAGFPRFKRRRETGSVRFCGNSFALVDRHHVRLAKVGHVKTYESRRLLARPVEKGTAKVTSVTVNRETGGWFVSFTAAVTRPDPAPRGGNKVIGVDVGLSTLFTGATPDGEHVLAVENPRNYVTSQARLAKAQRVTSRRQGPARGVAPSNRWKRANRRVQKCHARVANKRRDLLHNTTTRLVKDFDVIVLEDLNIKGMAKNKHLAKHIYDASWAEFVRQLEYKSKWYGATVMKADRFYPSSKTCSGCGEVKAKLSLAERTYCCQSCGANIDRDVNAAINLARLSETSSSHDTAGERGSAGTRCSLDVEARVRPQPTEGNLNWLRLWPVKRQPCQPCQPLRRLTRRYIGTTNSGAGLAHRPPSPTALPIG